MRRNLAVHLTDLPSRSERRIAVREGAARHFPDEECAARRQIRGIGHTRIVPAPTTIEGP